MSKQYTTGFEYSHAGDDWTDGKPYTSGLSWFKTPADTQRFAAELLRIAPASVITFWRRGDFGRPEIVR